MSFQAYLDSIRAKTGLGPDDFRARAAEKGLLEPGVKTGQIVAWLKADYGLGQGHAMAIVATLGVMAGAGLTSSEKIDRQFDGSKARWRTTYEEILTRAGEFGPVSVAPTNTYLSLLKGTKKFAIVQVTGDRLDLGLKLPRADDDARLEPSGSWNSMVTHRVRVTSPDQLDGQLLGWLRQAYDAA
ncbi:DUF4287 domain-containing protein [Lacisediminihabitans sp.]|uniref:DUF4287 domain-containing protein n=1 Tax=Lacisediminihabitans sp. TaxID=2787631 RepID=UPI00374CAE27